MADQEIDIKVKVDSDTGQLEVTGQKFDQTSQKTEQLEKSFIKLEGAGKLLLASFAGIASATGAIAFLNNAVKAAEEENEALRRLKFNLEAAGTSFEQNKEQINRWSAEIQALTRFSDTEAISTLERFVRVTNDLQQAQHATQLAMGLASASGKDLATVESSIADLLNGNERALITLRREFGGYIGDAQTAQQALDALAKKFSNAAFAEEGLTKTSAQFKNALGDLQEELGRGLIPALTDTIKLMTQFISLVNQAKEATTGFAVDATNSLADFTTKIATLGLSNFVDPFKPVKESLKAVVEEHKLAQEAMTEKARVETENQIQIKARLVVDEQERAKTIIGQQDAHVKAYLKSEEDKLDKLHKMQDKAMEEYISGLNKARDAQKKLADDMSGRLAGALRQTAFEGKNFGDAMHDMFMRLVEDIAFAIAKQLILKALLGATGGVGGGILSGLFGAPAAAAPSGFSNSGGVLVPNSAAPAAQNINVSVSTNSLDLSNADVILKKLAEEISAKTATAAKFATETANLAKQNSQRAV